MSLCSDRISFFMIRNPAKSNFNAIMQDKTALIIDEKYIPHTKEFVSLWGYKHPTFMGEIPPEDILAVVVEKSCMTMNSNLFDRITGKAFNYLERKIKKSGFSHPEYKIPSVRVTDYLRKHQKLLEPSQRIPIYVFDNYDENKMTLFSND